MREMKDSGVEWIGEIPKGWGICRLRFLCSITTGNQDTQDNDPEGEYPFYVRSPIVEKSKNYSFEGPAILMAGDGVGAGKVFHLVDGKYGCHQRVYSLQNIHDIDRRLLYYYLQNTFYISIDTANSKSTVDSVRLPMLQDYPVPIPPDDECRCIADYLDAKCAQIDRAIARQQEAIEKLKEYKLSVITEAVTKGLNPNVPMKDSGIEWIGEIPEGWDTVAFGRIAQVKSNLVDPSLYPDLPQISPESIEKDRGRIQSYFSVAESGVFSYNHYFYAGQILYSKIRPKLNKACIAPFEGLCSADMYPIETDADTRFILYCIISYSFLSQVCMVTESRVKMPKINQSELAWIMIALPPEKQAQEQIAEYLDRFCEKLDLVLGRKKVLIDKLTDYKKSLIYEVVTGKREV